MGCRCGNSVWKKSSCERLRHDTAEGLHALTESCGNACITEGKGISGLETVAAE
jgi:hypothetical protein